MFQTRVWMKIPFLVLLALLCWSCGDDDEWRTPPPAEQSNEPPANEFLADSPWPVNHANPYAQGSSSHPGPVDPPTGDEDFLLGRPATINAFFSSPYPDGKRVIWAAAYGEVFKADPETDSLAYIDRVESEPVAWASDQVSSYFATLSGSELATALENSLPGEPELREGEAGQGTSGIYCALGTDGIFYQPLGTRIVAYGDEVAGDRLSPIEIKREYEIPAELPLREWDKIMGLTMTYDGMLAFATNYGLVGIVDRDFETAHYLQIGTGDEYVYNSLATDEDGGIYVASHLAMYRVQWTGENLTIDENEGGWRAEYGTGQPNPLSAQSLAGTGSTPSLMGVGDQDKFVVITDGEKLMNIILFWRDKIPADWQQLPGTSSRRIAALVPITFGDPDRESSFSDQSVLVRGYGAFVVNNELQIKEPSRTLDTLLSGEPDHQPYGCEKFEWDPETRILESAWVNNEVSFPNAIPTMSEETNLIYEIGARDGIWTLEALDWDTGEVVWYYEVGDRARHNSGFAACQIGPDQSIYYGTFLGLIRLTP